jgi:DNA polymerase-3 subunit delta
VAKVVGEAVRDRDRTLVVEDFSDDDVDLGAVVQACQTPPFLADRRVVVVRDAGRFAADQLQVLVKYLEDPLATTKLVVAAGGGPLPARFVAAWRKSPAASVVATDVAPKEAHGWLTTRLREAPVKFERDAAAALEGHLGEDFSRLGALLAVLETAYGPGSRIGLPELAPYLGQPGSVPPWDLTDAIDRGDTDEALRALHRLSDAGGRHPLVLLAILHRHFANILAVQSPSITSEAEAAAAIGIPQGRSTFPAKKALDAARRLGPKGAGEAVVLLADAELALKGKLDWEPAWVLEVLVARLCRLSRTARTARPVGRGQGRR